MLRFIITAVIIGLLFGIMDGFINANPYGMKMMECYKPIARLSVNITAGIIADLIYGFAITGIYLLLLKGLPFDSGFMNGLVYGLIMWFFRVAMLVITNWVVFNVPVGTLLYILITGLFEMAILGVVVGLIIKK